MLEDPAKNITKYPSFYVLQFKKIRDKIQEMHHGLKRFKKAVQKRSVKWEFLKAYYDEQFFKM